MAVEHEGEIQQSQTLSMFHAYMDSLDRTRRLQLVQEMESSWPKRSGRIRVLFNRETQTLTPDAVPGITTMRGYYDPVGKSVNLSSMTPKEEELALDHLSIAFGDMIGRFFDLTTNLDLKKRGVSPVKQFRSGYITHHDLKRNLMDLIDMSYYYNYAPDVVAEAFFGPDQLLSQSIQIVEYDRNPAFYVDEWLDDIIREKQGYPKSNVWNSQFVDAIKSRIGDFPWDNVVSALIEQVNGGGSSKIALKYNLILMLAIKTGHLDRIAPLLKETVAHLGTSGSVIATAIANKHLSKEHMLRLSYKDAVKIASSLRPQGKYDRSLWGPKFADFYSDVTHVQLVSESGQFGEYDSLGKLSRLLPRAVFDIDAGLYQSLLKLNELRAELETSCSPFIEKLDQFLALIDDNRIRPVSGLMVEPNSGIEKQILPA